VSAQESPAAAKVPDDELNIRGVLETALPGTEQKYRLKLIVHPHFGDLHRLEYLRTPIGLRYDRWREDGDGLPHLPSGAYLTAREWAKFGLLVLNQGQWQGKPVVKAESLAECFKTSPANPNYALTFWKAKPDDPEPDLVIAAGKGKQKLFILPSRGLLIVQFADAERRYQERRFLDLALGRRAAADP
jgi:CubicO group peptidase (beta-lactamase class C family)